MKKRFPKKLVFAAVVLELLILTLSNPTKLLSSLSDNDPPVRVNFLSIQPALPNASMHVKALHRPVAATKAVSAKPVTEGPTVVVAEPPQPVI
jgi:hypothetical protein